MKLKKYSGRLYTAWLLLLLTGLSFSLNAKPTVDRASLRYGFSPSIKRFSWGTLSCRIVNPDPRPYEIELRFVDANRGAVNHKTVFTEKVYLPPETIIRFTVPVMTEDAEEYSLEVFVDGRETQKTDSFIIRLISGNASYMPMLNDSNDISMGSFSICPEFKGKLVLSNFSSASPPIPWLLIKKASCLVVVRPDFSRYSSDAFRSILDYVRQGGNIIFADPVGTLEASKTPLSVLLPIVPLRIRKVAGLESLSKKIPEFKKFAGSVDFLESVPVGDGIDFLKEGDFPLFRWKKYGLGTCRFSAIPIVKDSFTDTEPWLKILQAFFAHQTVSNDLSTAIQPLDEMTGFTVPEIDSVRIIFIIYFFLMVIPLSLGIFFKRTGMAWMLTAVITVSFSLYILKMAASGLSKQSGTFVSFIETSIPGVTAAPGEGWYGIFSTSDTKLSIKARNEQTLLSAIPPPDNIMAMFNASGGIGGKAFSQPTEVKIVNAMPEFVDLVLNSNASRQFYAAYDSTDMLSLDSPVLQYKKDGFEFEDWKIPEELNPYAVWLQFANGIVPLAIKEGTVSMDNSAKAAFSSDTTLLSVQNFIKKGWKHSAPMMVIVENASETLLDLPKNIVSHGKKITVLPLKEVSEQNILSVPSQAVLFSPGDTSTRLVMTGNEIKSSIISRSDSEYVFRYQLPPLFSGIKAEKIEIDFKYLNEGGNVNIEPGLLVGSIRNKKFVQKREIKGKRQSNGRYLFTDVADSVNYGTGFVVLKIKIKRTNLPMGERLRSNKWSLGKLDITVTGAMPESASTFKF